MTLQDIKNFFTDRHTLFLEEENALLKAQLSIERLKLEEALKPKPLPMPIKKDFSQFKPMKTSWEAYRDEQNALLEQQALAAQGN